MSLFATYLVVTFAGGLLARLLRLPALVGFLAAGFVLGALDVGALPALEIAADLGVTLLLFGIGLKLDLKTLLRPEVWLTAGVHALVSVLVGTGFLVLLGLVGLSLVQGTSLGGLALVALALSFSSTVLAVKVLEERSETLSLYGRISIGILVVQDLVAVAFLVVAEDRWPSWWALGLLLLPLLVPPLRWAWDRVGHGEMQVLFGFCVALVPGYALFDAVGLKGDLGAIVMGVLLARHPAAGELSRSLFGVKELLLVAFFVSIGLTGVPTWPEAGLGLALLLLLPLQAGLYVLLLWARGLRQRTAVLTGLVLENFSEFALIVVVVAAETGRLDQRWLSVMSVSVAVSFVASVVINRRGSRVVRWVAGLLPERPRDRLHPRDRPIDVGYADAVVLGMGRIGRSAYESLSNDYGLRVVGVESNEQRVELLHERGFAVVNEDAEDAAFWERLTRAHEIDLAVLAMPFHGSNVQALQRLREAGFAGTVAAVAQYDDELVEARARGADAVLHLYDGAGRDLAERAVEAAGSGDDPPTWVRTDR